MEITKKMFLTETDLQTIKSFVTRPIFLHDEIEFARFTLDKIAKLKAPIELTDKLWDDLELDILDNAMYNYVSFGIYREIDEKGTVYVTDYIQNVILLRCKLAYTVGFNLTDFNYLTDIRLHIRKDVWLDLYAQFLGYIRMEQ